MNFEEAFARYKDGIATEEEKAYVRQQLEIANAFVADDEKRQSVPVAEASDDDVKKAKKKLPCLQKEFANGKILQTFTHLHLEEQEQQELLP